MSADVLLGLDVGVHTGYVVLTPSLPGRYRYVAHGVITGNYVASVGEVVDMWAPTLVAVEVPQGYVHEHARGKALLDAARLGGELVGHLRTVVERVEQVSAQEARKALCGRATATDAMVKAAVGYRVPTWPRRSNDHERDAALAAMFAFERAQHQRRMVAVGDILTGDMVVTRDGKAVRW